MGAVAGPIAVVASLASIGMGAYAEHEKGKGQQAADNYQAARADQAAEYARTAAAQTDAQDREELNIKLDNIDAVRASSGVGPGSPTTAALLDRTAELGERKRAIQVDNALAQAHQDNADAAYLRQAGSFSLATSDLSAGAKVLGGIAKTNFSTFGMPS